MLLAFYFYWTALIWTLISSLVKCYWEWKPGLWRVSMGRKTLWTMSDNVRVEHYAYYLLTENVNFRKHEEESQETQAN